MPSRAARAKPSQAYWSEAMANLASSLLPRVVLAGALSAAGAALGAASAPDPLSFTQTVPSMTLTGCTRCFTPLLFTILTGLPAASLLKGSMPMYKPSPATTRSCSSREEFNKFRRVPPTCLKRKLILVPRTNDARVVTQVFCRENCHLNVCALESCMEYQYLPWPAAHRDGNRRGLLPRLCLSGTAAALRAQSSGGPISVCPQQVSLQL